MKLMIMGPPGSGKGTQAAYITSKYEIAHISTGDIIRDNIKRDTELGREFQSYTSKGALVPDDLVIKLVEDRLAYDDCANGFLLDGFPRTIYQAESLEKLVHLDAVINLNVPDDEVTKRLLNRAKIEGRADDTEEVIRHRLKVYHDQTSPLIKHYAKKGILKNIDGTPTDRDLIFNNIVDALPKY